MTNATTTTKHHSTRADWVERHIGRELDHFQRVCVDVVCNAMRCGPYDFARTFETAEWRYGLGVSFKVTYSQLATYDTDGLTSLVLDAHDHCIRIQISPHTFNSLRIGMWPRQRDPSGGYMRQYARHPSIESVIKRRREADINVTDGHWVRDGSWS